MSSEDIRFHVTGLHGIKETSLQHALDLRLNGALVHIYEASSKAMQRRQKPFRVGRLAIPPEMVEQKKAFKDALNTPGKRCILRVGPYDLTITLYRECESRETKLKKQNEKLRERLGDLERMLKNLQQQKKESESLLVHVLDSKTPVITQMTESSRYPRGPLKRRPGKKRHPKRSPVHKRLKIPEMNWADCNDDEQIASETRIEHFSENSDAKFQSQLTDILNEFLMKETAMT